MKKILLLVALAFNLSLFAQAPLPTSYNFTGFAGSIPQVGWKSVVNLNPTGTFTYSGLPMATASGVPAGKIDFGGEYILIKTANDIGKISYYLRANVGGSPTPTSFIGTFYIQESPDSLTWNNLAIYSDSAAFAASPLKKTMLLTAYKKDSVTATTGSRFIRFILATKKNGCNIGIDDIALSQAISGAQEINVKYAGNTIFSGSNTPYFGSAVGTPSPVSFLIENQGSANPLNLSSITISGAAASDYTFGIPNPTTVGASSSTNLIVTFNPSANGTRDAVLTINNDDANEGTYVVNLKGVGGTLATEPANSANTITFSNISSFRAIANNAPIASAEGFLIIRKKSNSTITDIPVDGTNYQKGNLVGSSKVLYSGPGAASYVLKNVYAAETHQLAIFPYNGDGTFINYKTSTPSTNSVTTLSTMQAPTEYAGIVTSSPTFIGDLTALVNPHTPTLYDFYDETMVREFTAYDTTQGRKALNCVYSNFKYAYNEPLAWVAADFSREHTYAQSWMPTPNVGGTATLPERPEYNDQHNLYPTKQNNVNAVRSNYPLGEVTGTVSSTFGDGKLGLNNLGQLVYEPAAQHKGNAARAIMYMAIAYHNIGGYNWKLKNPIGANGITYGQDQNILKKWHFQDPPDNFEISRNDFVDSLQGNRNPFIDSANYVCFIDFSNMTKITSPSSPCYVLGLNTITKKGISFQVYPNPSNGDLNIVLDAPAKNAIITLTDMLGRTIYNEILTDLSGKKFLNVSNLNKGTYVLGIESNGSKATQIIGKQ
jgi:endonuclease I